MTKIFTSHLEDHLVVDKGLDVMLVDKGAAMSDNDIGPAEAAPVRAYLHSACAQMRVDGHKAVQESVAAQQPGKKTCAGIVSRDYYCCKLGCCSRGFRQFSLTETVARDYS